MGDTAARRLDGDGYMATLTERDGRLQLDVVDDELAVLRDLLGRVADLLTDPESNTDSDATRRTPTDPVLSRLLPDGHRDDPDVAAAQRDLTETSLRLDKRADAAAVLAALPTETGTAVIDDIDTWLRALNDVRLMLGVELGITEDSEPPRWLGDPRDEQLAVYFWLTQLQDYLIAAVLT